MAAKSIALPTFVFVSSYIRDAYLHLYIALVYFIKDAKPQKPQKPQKPEIEQGSACLIRPLVF